MGDSEAELDQIRQILADDEKLSRVTKAVFDVVDEDLSGLIDKTELKQAMINVAKEAGLPHPTDDQVSSALHNLDTDGSGSIDVHELKILISLLLQAILNQ